MRQPRTKQSDKDAVDGRGSGTDLSSPEVALVELATRVIDEATDAGHGEEGLHTMAAAARAADGRTFVGVNLFHFTGGPCAELVALGAARAAGARQITHIVAVGNHGRGVCAPCGKDRQIFVDHYPDLRVIMPGENGPRSVPATDLLPGAYRVVGP